MDSSDLHHKAYAQRVYNKYGVKINPDYKDYFAIRELLQDSFNVDKHNIKVLRDVYNYVIAELGVKQYTDEQSKRLTELCNTIYPCDRSDGRYKNAAKAHAQLAYEMWIEHEGAKI
jgi:glycerate-2-kinase